MHAQLQSRRSLPLVHLRYEAHPGYRLVPYADSPLLLAFTRQALIPGTLPASAPKQLISSFAWDEDQATAHFLLPTSISEQCQEWFVTLCAVVDSEGLCAVGISARLGSLPSKAVAAGQGCATAGAADAAVANNSAAQMLATGGTGGLATAAGVVPWRSLSSSIALHDQDMSLLDQVGVGAAAGSAGTAANPSTTQLPASSWQGSVHVYGWHSHGGTERGVTVDMIAPQPLPPAEEAGLVVKAAAGKVVVSLRPKKGAALSASVWPHDSQYAVQLPAEVAQGQVEGLPAVTKLSRKLGILSSRFVVAE